MNLVADVSDQVQQVKFCFKYLDIFSVTLLGVCIYHYITQSENISG